MTANLTKKTLGVLGVLVVLGFGIWWGGHPDKLPGFLRSALVANPHDAVVGEALSDIQREYYRPVGRSGLIDGALAGAVAALHDPYSSYESPVAFTSFTHPVAPHVVGVGIDVTPVPRGLRVESVIAGSPAKRQGVRSGDLIVSVNGRSLARLPSQTAVTLIRGRAGTRVTLGLTRGAEHLRLTLRRQPIASSLVESRIERVRGVSIGVIFLPTFDVEGIHAEVAASLESLLHSHVKAIVLDLRENGGGLVSEAQLVTSMFLSHGVIVTTRGRAQTPVTLRATGDPIAPTIPLAVLVNRDTASAAEIVTGALQDNHRAVVVGTPTYGKGVFQELRPLSNGGALDITAGQYYLPNGKNLGAGALRRGPGIMPNVVVALPSNARSDLQLGAALRLLAARVR